MSKRSPVKQASLWEQAQNQLRRVPGACWMCVLIALLNAVSWSLITPPFQVPDEPDHFAYVKSVAETGTKPTSGATVYSAEEGFALQALNSERIRLGPSYKAIYSRSEQAALQRELAGFDPSKEQRTNAAGVAASEPPLYYAVASIPYSLGSSGTLLDRLQLIRLFSAMFAALTTLFTFIFLRETLPSVRWAWTAGALGVALFPLLGFMSGAVNPDAMLFALSAALFSCIARAFRRGLTMRLAIATGAVIAVGLMTKWNFLGLMPGAALALGIFAVRGAREGGRGGLRAPATAAGIGAIPILGYILSNLLSDRPPLGILTTTVRESHGSVFKELDFIWQFYLPKLPSVPNYFPGVSTTRQIWFDGFIGRLGWLDTFFPGWVYTLALALALVLLGLFVRALATSAAELRARLPELAVYIVSAVGLLLLIGSIGYGSLQVYATGYGEARYLLPLLPLFGAFLALAARGAGRRFGPAAGLVIVGLVMAHDVFSQLQVVARYYG